jgi:hypothetical protein
MKTYHFIILDDSNTVSGNEFDRSYPKVQIICPANGNSPPDNEASESYSENVSEHHRERDKQSFTIKLNVDSGQ